VLITKIGGAESNSFVTVSEADSIVASLPDDSSGWEDLSTSGKEYRLVLAARLMSYLPWSGRKAFCNQALCFPRNIQSNVKEIPQEVKEAQVFIAYSLIHRALAARPTSVTEEETGMNVKSVSLGGLLSVSFSGDPILNGTTLEKLVRSTQFPAYLGVSRYTTQVRGGTVIPAEDETCSTTTTTTSTTSTTTTSTTSTTT